HPRVERLGDLRFRLLDLLSQVRDGGLAGVELAPDHAGRVSRLCHLGLELANSLLHGLGRSMLLLDRCGSLFRASDLGDDLTRLGELLDQLATLLSQLRELE